MFVPLNTLQLLIVDDQALVRTAMRMMLTALGAKHLTEAASGEEAIGLLLRQPFDLVISDIDMSPINGLELLKHIRSGDYGLKRETLLIMLTGISTREFVRACIALEVNAFLTKPPKKELLMERIQYALTTPFHIQEAKVYSALALPAIDAPAAPSAAPSVAAAPASGRPGSEAESEEKPPLPGMLYIIWSDKFAVGLPSLDEVLRAGAVLTNRAYADKGKPLPLAELDAFIGQCLDFATTSLRALEETAGQSNPELQKAFALIRIQLSAGVARTRLVLQVSPDSVMYELFQLLKTWWQRNTELVAEYHRQRAP